MRARAFTLLEVMVAVAIVGLALTVILSAQTGLYASSGYAQHVSIATGLARCRMTELEEKLLRTGFQELDSTDEGPCCDDTSRPDFTCKWKVEKVTLPAMDLTGSDGGSRDPLSALASALGTSGTSSGAGPLGGLGAMGGLGAGAPLGAIGALNGLGSAFASDAGSSGVASQLTSGAGIFASLAPIAMSFVYPTLKPMFEASIRRVTVRVNWKEGLRDRDLTVVQFVSHPTRGFPPTADGGIAGASSLGGLGAVLGASPLGGALTGSGK